MPQSGTMLQPSTESPGVERWISSVVGSLAKTYQSPANKSESPKANEVGFGRSLPESWAKWDQDSSSWKTSQDCLWGGGLESFSETWPRWGLMLNGLCYQPEQLEPPILENESFLLPTPTAHLSDFPMVSWGTAENKLKNGLRKSGARIGSDLGWDLCINYLLNGYNRFPGWVNPLFCEWMMGWPPGWSYASEAHSKSLVTESFRSKQRRRGKS